MARDPTVPFSLACPPVGQAASRERETKGPPVTAVHRSDDLDRALVIPASEPSRTAPFTGLSPRGFSKLVTVVRREAAEELRRARPWGLRLGPVRICQVLLEHSRCCGT